MSQEAVEFTPGDAWDERHSSRLAYTLKSHIIRDGMAHPMPPPQPHVSSSCLLPLRGDCSTHVHNALHHLPKARATGEFLLAKTSGQNLVFLI